MKVINYFLSVFIVIILMQSCSTLYYGHTKEEWNNLTEKERLVSKKEYQPIIDSRNEQIHTDKINARTHSVIDYGAGQ